MSWDSYFLQLCKTVSTKSPCLSRQIGAILVRDKSIVSTGYNGPPRGIPHCGVLRYNSDKLLKDQFWIGNRYETPIGVDTTCPRRLLNISSGEGMQWCTAQHAEENAVSNAARNGVSVLGCTLYMNAPIPCKNCFGTLINAGITEIVIPEAKVYDKYTQFLIDNSTIKIREFQLHKEPPYAKS
jgi:dCMP deaminase